MDATARLRSRDLGIPFGGNPGRLNAITDVPGVLVGYRTMIEGDDVRTGVTAILPRGHEIPPADCPAGWFSLNGNGEMTGTTWIEESGRLNQPVLLSSTHAIGAMHEAVIRWLDRNGLDDGDWHLPVVAETWDGWLSNGAALPVRAEQGLLAIESARGGAVAEGSVGGGTGMIAFGFKGGTGTASRRIDGIDGVAGSYVLGALVQANFGSRHQLSIAGVPVGAEIPELDPWAEEQPNGSSIIAVLATDLPLLPGQCKALARRAALGIGRTGGVGGISSGDIFLAFSTTRSTGHERGLHVATYLPWERIDPLYEAAVDVIAEAITNALVCNETMTGWQGRTVHALPHDRLVDVLRRYGRITR